MRSGAKKVARPGLMLLAIAALAVTIPGWGSADIGAPSVAQSAVPASASTPAAVRGVQLAAAATVTVDLCALAGTKTMPDGSSVPIWGFALDGNPGAEGCGAAAAGLPGPVLGIDTLGIAAGDTVVVNFENQLSQAVSLAFPGQPLAPDTTGVAAGVWPLGSKTYTFIANTGTFLYQAGTNVTTQVPMGLYGALVVNATTGAYGTGTAFDKQAVLVLSEVDPYLNAAPLTFNLLDYHPKFWLINGQGFDPSGATLNPAVSAAAGQKVLLRYLNAGLEHHTMLLLGSHERLIAKDAGVMKNPYDAVAETIPAGATMDAIVTIPSGAVTGSKLWLYNRQLHLDDGSAPFTPDGGMMASVAVT
jgi:FtsP/CotA-like multicopper oxidase with cupredoxin domain